MDQGFVLPTLLVADEAQQRMGQAILRIGGKNDTAQTLGLAMTPLLESRYGLVMPALFANAAPPVCRSGASASGR